MVSVTPLPLFTSGKDPVPVIQEDGWAPGPVWTGGKNLAPTGIRSPDRPARSQSLYRLRYPAHRFLIALPNILLVYLQRLGSYPCICVTVICCRFTTLFGIVFHFPIKCLYGVIVWRFILGGGVGLSQGMC
jgi:hypothetical protein